MATLAFGLAGAVVGSFFGMPQLGFVLGSILGQILFPTKGKNQQGPMLGDLSVMSSTYGAPIAIGYGTYRMAGNMIWSLPLIQVVTVTTVGGGKGMGGGQTSTQTTYTYFATFALQWGAGPAVSLTRLWADGTLIYDDRTNSPTAIAGGTYGLSFTFYPGDENQLPDPTIEANIGVGLVPAFRGTTYSVFNEIPISYYGNRIPSLAGEILFSGITANTVRYGTEFTSVEGGIFTSVSHLAVDRNRRLIYQIGSGSSGSGWRVWNMDTMQEVRQTLSPTTVSVGSALTCGDNGSGNLIGGDGPGNYDPVIWYGPNSLQEAGRYGVSAIFGDGRWPSNTVRALSCQVEGTMVNPFTNGNTYIIAGLTEIANALYLINEDETFVWESGDGAYQPGGSQFSTDWTGLVAALPVVGQVTFYFGVQDHTNSNADITIYEANVVGTYDVISDEVDTYGVGVPAVGNITSASWDNDGSGHAIGPILDQTDGGLIFIMGGTTAWTSYVMKWLNGSVVWSTKVAIGTPGEGTVHTICGQSSVTGGRFGWVDGRIPSHAVLIDTSDGSIIIPDATAPNGTFNASGEQFYDGDSQSIYTQLSFSTSILGQLFLGQAAGLGVGVGDILTDISSRVGFLPADIDVSSLEGVTTTGYCITQQMHAADAVSPLALAYYFDAVESDGKMVFKQRGESPIRTLTKSDLPWIDDSKGKDDVVQETRIEEWEIPPTLSLNFIDYDLDEQPNSAAAARFSAPAAGTFARNQPTFNTFQVPTLTVGSLGSTATDLAIVMTATQAAQLVEKLLFTMWQERMHEAFRGDSGQLDLDPGDVINIDLENGTILTVRVTKTTMNIDFSVTFESVAQNKVTFESTTKVMQSGLGHIVQSVPKNVATLLFLLDMPLLRDTDDTGGTASRLNIAMNGYSAGWPGGNLWDSTDGTTFVNSGVKCPTGVSYGLITNALPDTDFPFVTDRSTVLEVNMISGTLSSVDTTDFRNDMNVAIIGDPVKQNWEVVDFQNAVQGENAGYAVSTLMRARRGTETQVGTHASGEYFIVPTPGTFSTLFLALGQLGVQEYYRGVGYGSIMESADIFALKSTGADLKPYAPVHLFATTSGGGSPDFTLTWVRRNRTGGELRDLFGVVPMTEQSENYSIDIYGPVAFHTSQLADLAIHEYHFDETVGTTATDRGSSVSSGTYHGGFTLSSTAITPDNAFTTLYNGSTGYVDLGFTDPPAAANGAFSIEFVFNAVAVSGNPCIVANDHTDSNQAGYQVRLNGGNLTFDVGFATIATTTPITAATTHHVVCVFDGTRIYLYLDGALVNSTAAGGGYSAAGFNSNVARNPNYNGDFFHGQVSDLAFYSYALSASTVLRHYGESVGNAVDVVRTLTALTPTVLYPNAEIVADFGTPPSQITFEVYQLSAAVGRGYGAQTTVIFGVTLDQP